MFDISFFEILIISIIALIVVGPERLPQVARTLGHLISRCRQFVYSVRTDIHNEIRMEELKQMHHTMQDTVQSIEDSVRKEINEIKSVTESESNNKAVQTHPNDSRSRSGPESETESTASTSRQQSTDHNQSSP
ncbi:Sec-independent protein translocase TatB [Nitrosomonas marina]|uniref:Sec-independent protein translocase protein TatB n=1 Tax=Nitrosomonas marina TaxID=917 RepID=A0A1H9ZVJ4_9PROT|nr:Sec-independent protein translocase protein TatB [Nitrosomonas marina]SES85801.1 Sec-independent protein translocase TatB [Nitrosomonas marina]